MTKGGKWAALFKTTYYKPQKCSGKWTFNHTGIRTTKGRRFFWRFSAISLKVKCPCYLSNWYNRHWRCSPRSSVKNCSICFLETELVEQQFAMGLKKEDCLFPIIYKDQLAANIFIFYLFIYDYYYLVFSKLSERPSKNTVKYDLYFYFWGQRSTKGLWIRLQKVYWQNGVLFWHPHPSK